MTVMSDVTVFLNPALATVVSGAVIPLLVGLAVKLEARKGIYVAAAAVLSVVAGILTTLASGVGVSAQSMATMVVIAFVSNVASYAGIWKPVGMLGTGDQVGKVNKAVSGFIG